MINPDEIRDAFARSRERNATLAGAELLDALTEIRHLRARNGELTAGLSAVWARTEQAEARVVQLERELSDARLELGRFEI